MNRKNTARLGLLFLFLLFSAQIHASEIVYGLPDSLEELRFWGNSGEFVGLSAEVTCPPVPVISVTPECAIVDRLETYAISVELPSVAIHKLGGFAFSFPYGFGLGQISDIEYSDDYEGEDLEIRRAYVFGNFISILFRWGFSPPPGTVITLKVHSIRNPTASGTYQIAGLIFNRWFRVLAGPSLSEGFEIVADQPVSLAVVPDEPIMLRAGQSQVFEAIASDRFGNRISGLEIGWSFSPAYDDLGIVSGGNLLATTVGMGKVVASYADLTAESGLITVIPGDMDHFEIVEYPSSVQAGEDFPSPVTVAAYDLFDNLKNDYGGDVYFVSSDPLAELYYNESHKYHFVEGDSGIHSFEGSAFSLRTIGSQTITVTDGEHYGSSGSIGVGGGPLVSFDLSYAQEAVAGRPFEVSVTNAVDRFGNPASGVVAITLVQGGPSPGGFEPILSDIYILEGRGTADQYLFESGPAVLKATIDSAFQDISFDVLPGRLGDLILHVQPTQFVGNPLIGPATITAIDAYGNIKTDFDASMSPVQLTVNRGELSPDILDDAYDFVDGIADLTQKSITYSGLAGEVILGSYAGGVGAIDASVTFNGIDFEIDSTIPDSIFGGQALSISLVAFNNGDLMPYHPVNGFAYFSSCPDECREEIEIVTLRPGQSIESNFFVYGDKLNPGTQDTLVFGMVSRYPHEGDTIVVVQNLSYPLAIKDSLYISYVDGSLSHDSLLSQSFAESLSFQMELSSGFEGDYAWAEIDLFIDLGGGISGLLNDQGGARARVEDRILTVTLWHVKIPDYSDNPAISEGYKRLSASVFIDRGDQLHFRGTLDSFDSVYVLFASELSVVRHTLEPRLVGGGTISAFGFDVLLEGDRPFVLDSTLSDFMLRSDDFTMSTGLPADSIFLFPGVNHVTTGEFYIPPNTIGEELILYAKLAGKELYAVNGVTRKFTDEPITVIEAPKIKIVSTDLETLNPPFVNRSQPFSVSVAIANLSDDDIGDVSVFIQSEDGSETFAEMHDVVIPASSTKEVLLDLTAPDYSISAFAYKAVLSAPGTAILPPADNIVTITVQSPAEIELAYDLHGVFGNYVDYEQPFTVEVRLVNLGEASADSGEVSLLTSGVDFSVPDSSAVRLAVGGSAEFHLVAPSTSLTTDLIVKVTGIPTDENSGQPALVTVESVSIPIIVEASFAELVVGAVGGGGPLVVGAATRELFSLNLRCNTSNPLDTLELRSITMRFTDGRDRAISPEKVLLPDSTGFYSGDNLLTTASAQDNRLITDFDMFRLESGSTATIVFRARFCDVIEIEDFKINIDSRDIRAVFATGPRINQAVPVRGEHEQVLSLGLTFVVVHPVAGDLESSITAQNNPFNPSTGADTIAYYLDMDANVTMAIYTLTGEKVYETTFNAGSEGGTGDKTNKVAWDGKNDEGEDVMNGVYIVYIRPDYSCKPGKLKIAVLK
jgi:hypothetical protein